MRAACIFCSISTQPAVLRVLSGVLIAARRKQVRHGFFQALRCSSPSGKDERLLVVSTEDILRKSQNHTCVSFVTERALPEDQKFLIIHHSFTIHLPFIYHDLQWFSEHQKGFKDSKSVHKSYILASSTFFSLKKKYQYTWQKKTQNDILWLNLT